MAAGLGAEAQGHRLAYGIRSYRTVLMALSRPLCSTRRQQVLSRQADKLRDFTVIQCPGGGALLMMVGIQPGAGHASFCLGVPTQADRSMTYDLYVLYIVRLCPRRLSPACPIRPSEGEFRHFQDCCMITSPKERLGQRRSLGAVDTPILRTGGSERGE